LKLLETDVSSNLRFGYHPKSGQEVAKEIHNIALNTLQPIVNVVHPAGLEPATF